MAGKQDARGTNGKIVRLVLPFVIATATTVIVWFTSAPATAPNFAGGTRPADTSQPQLIGAVLAGFVALMISVIALKFIKPRSRSRRSR